MGGALLPYRRVAPVLTALAVTMLLSSVAAAQTAVFTGRVTSTGGQPLGGASVGIPDLGVGGIADADGRYTFTVEVAGRAGRSANVVARYIGYKPKRLPVTLNAGRVEHNFELERDVLNLEEVVVTGTSEATSQKKATFAVGVVDNTQLKEVPASSPLAALQAKVPGASVVTTSGQPGSAPSIRLRSATSLTGRQDPLVIVDGTIARLSLADINTEDIERIEVIKGAAASSLYGSDAANGVIQIFTKRGASLAEGQTSFTLRTEYGQNNLPKVIEGNMSHNYIVMCGATVCANRVDASSNSVTDFDVSSGGRTSDEDLIADNRYPVYHDQLRKVFRPGDFLTNYVSVGQRRGTTNFNASFQNQRDAGVLNILEGYNRQNFRLNVDQALTETIDLGMGAFYGRSHADQGEDHGIFFGLRFIEPNIRLDSIVNCGACAYNGAYNPVIKQAPLSTNVVNPLYVLSQQDVSNDRNRFTGTFRASYRPLTWLTGEANVGYDDASVNYRFFTPVGFTNSGGVPNKGGLFHRNNADRTYNTNVGVTTVRSFWDDQIRNTTKAAFQYEDQRNALVSVNASELTVREVPEFSNVTQTATITPASRTESIRAKNYFLITTFDIMDRYVLDGLVRRDESSLFGADERSAIYHRISGAWRVSEDFALPGVDELKLRASHGTAGLRPPFQAQYEIFSLSGGLPQPLNLGNNQLKPAFSAENEYGFNLNFLTNYSLEYSFSEKRTTDQIIRVPVTAASGYKTQWQNAGTLEGTTHEAALSAVLLSKADYFWRVNFTGDRTRQKITDLKVGEFLIGPFETSQNAQMFRIAEGQPFGVLYGDRWIRTPQQLQETIDAGALTGTVADYTLNEEGYYVRTSQYHTINEVPLKHFFCTDRSTAGACTASKSVQQIGDVNPNFTLGFNTMAQWKGLAMNATLSWISGGSIYNYTRQWPFNELRDAVIDQSGKPDPGACPSLATNPTCPYQTGRKPTTYYSSFYNNFNPNDYFVEKGSYVRLRELAFNYTLPARWAAKIPGADFRSARIGLVGRNLWTNTEYSGYDPDVTAPTNGNPFAYRVDYFTYPAYRTFTAMLELGF